MSGHNRIPRTQNIAGQRGHTPIVRAGIHITGRPRSIRFKEVATAVILILGLALLVTGCARLTHDEMPTPVPYADLPPTLVSTTDNALLPAEPQDEATLPAPAVHGPTVLRTDPSVVSLAVGETRLVQVWLDNVEQLHSIEFHINFAPKYIRIEDANPNVAGIQIGAGVIPMPAQMIRNEVDNSAGLIIYQAAQAPGSPVSGSGMVASFTARALADGGSPLRFSVVNLRDPEGQPLSTPEQIDGLVVIGSGGTTPEPTTAPPPAVPGSPAPTADTYHTVQPGENLFRIALRYGTTVDAIVAANNLSDSGSVQAGQVLRIPVGSPTSTDTYVVQPGDTLYSITRRFNTTVETLAALNGIALPYTIEVGQVLSITP